MGPDTNKPQPFDPEDTGELDIPVEMQKAAEQTLNATFNSEDTTEFQQEFGMQEDNDWLVAERKADLERLAPIVADKNATFNQKTLDDRDHIAEQRQHQYQVEKEFFTAPNHDFNEKTGLAPEEQEAERLTDQQRILLNTVTKLADGVGFDEVHPDLNRNEVLRPRSAPIDDATYREADVTQTVPLPPTPLEEAQARQGLEVQANMTYGKFEVLTGQRDATDLVEREKGPHAIVSVDREALRRSHKPIPTEALVAVGLVLLAIPLFGWSIYNQTHADAESDRIQSEQAMALATETADKKSLANQMEEPFRMPAGQTGPLGGSNLAHEDNAGDGGAAKRAQGELANWKPPAHPTPAPTDAQLAENRKLLAQADQMEALGNTTQAAYLLAAALGHCPGDVNLVIAAARKYIALRDYSTARNILKGAMNGARTLGDYSLLLQALNQIPGG